MSSQSGYLDGATAEQRGLRDLPDEGWPRFSTLIRRAGSLHCPECGAPGILKNWLTMRERCPRCAYLFEREDGYFLGAYAINLIVAEFITIGLLVWFLVASDYSWVILELIFIPMAVLLPLAFFPYARTLFMALDLNFTHENQL